DRNTSSVAGRATKREQIRALEANRKDDEEDQRVEEKAAREGRVAVHLVAGGGRGGAAREPRAVLECCDGPDEEEPRNEAGCADRAPFHRRIGLHSCATSHPKRRTRHSLRFVPWLRRWWSAGSRTCLPWSARKSSRATSAATAAASRLPSSP